MAKRTINNVKLGIFVTTGLVFLILLLYVIGNNQNMFGNTFVLKARFENVNGLMPGNNIRFAGINAGTVKSIEVLNDSTIEVTLLIKNKMKGFIHNNAMATITTDGLMGNKLVNIESVKAPAPLVQEGDVLFSKPSVHIDDILKVLNETTSDIAIIAGELKLTVRRINESQVLWQLLNDESLPSNLRYSLTRIRNASEHMDDMMINLDAIVMDLKQGKGSLGQLLKDTALVVSVKDAVDKIQKIGASADSLSIRINALVSSIHHEIDNGEGSVSALLKDRKMKDHLDKSIQNIEQGTKAFNENMEAIKHSFLFRGYFRKLDKQNKNTTPGHY